MSDVDDGRLGGGWWARIRQAILRRTGGLPSTSLTPGDGTVYRSKAVPRLLDHLSGLKNPVLLDLGPVVGANVSFLGDRLGCKVYIEDVYSDLAALVQRGDEAAIAPWVRACLAREPASVDAVLAWDVADYLDDDEASALVARIVRVLRPGGMVLALFTTARIDRPFCRKYIIEDADHLRHRWVPFARSVRRVRLGGDVERLFAPLQAEEVYLLRHRQRETLFRRRAGPRKAV